MSPRPHEPPNRAAAVALLTAPLLLGLAVGWVGERSMVGALALYAEPLVTALGVYALLYFTLSRRGLAALALALGMILGGLALHPGAHPARFEQPRPAWAEALHQCATRSEPAAGPLRVLTRRLDVGRPFDMDAVLAAQADLMVFHGFPGPEDLAELAEKVDGESRFFVALEPEDTVGIVVRGVFRTCGGTADSWEATLPSTDRRRARLIVTFPEIDGVGRIPLIVADLDRPGSLGEWPGWPGRLLTGSQQLATVARAVGGSELILLADQQAPRSFRHVDGALMGAGLQDAGGPATWPHRLGPIPGLTVHALDRVWHGPGWVTRAARANPGGQHMRDGLVVDLGPASFSDTTRGP